MLHYIPLLIYLNGVSVHPLIGTEPAGVNVRAGGCIYALFQTILTNSRIILISKFPSIFIISGGILVSLFFLHNKPQIFPSFTTRLQQKKRHDYNTLQLQQVALAKKINKINDNCNSK